MFAGILMICASMWSMPGWTPDVDAWSLALTTFTQGVGLGFIFIPLQVVGTALFSLMRNVGSALGISISSFPLAQTTQIMHAHIVEDLTLFNRMLQNGGAYFFWNSATAPGRAALNAGNAPSLNHRPHQ
jgi:MFS transporter, DHA2 family, multidrug resistance protein